MSAWVMGPDRGLDKIEREDPDEYAGYEVPPTFYPELISSEKVRQRVQSSGYGKVTAPAREIVDPNVSFAPWEERPTFKPALGQTDMAVKLRGKACSHGYGKSPVQLPPPKEPETPSFKLQLLRSPLGQQLAAAAPSSGYGRVTAVASPQPKPEQPSFKPQFSGSKTAEKMRLSARSSHYGRVAISPRPSTAPAGGRVEAESPVFVPRYTLLQDKPQAPPPRTPSPVFHLDCVATARNRRGSLGGAGPLSRDAHTPARPATSDLNEKIRKSVRSSNYGKLVPKWPVRKVEADEPKNPYESPYRDDSTSGGWNIRPGSIDEFEPINAGAITEMGKKAPSSGYGSVTPETKARFFKQPEPVWSPITKKGVTEELPPAPPAPKNKLTEMAASHGYGVNPPEKVPRDEFQFEAVWVPPPLTPKALPPAPPVPEAHNTKYPHIHSQYGSTYSANGAHYDDEEQ